MNNNYNNYQNNQDDNIEKNTQQLSVQAIQPQYNINANQSKKMPIIAIVAAIAIIVIIILIIVLIVGYKNKRDITDCNITYVPPTNEDTHKGIVYLDPTDLDKKCTEKDAKANVNEHGTPTTVKAGCMKFYIFDDSNSTYKMILDHNTSGNIDWISTEDYLKASGEESIYIGITEETAYGPITVTNRLKDDTQEWKITPRLITANEIAHIVGADREDTLIWDSSKNFVSHGEDVVDLTKEISYFSFEGSGNTYTFDGWQNVDNSKKYKWLYDNTISDRNKYPDTDPSYRTTGSTISGYWTSDLTVGTKRYAWLTHYASLQPNRSAYKAGVRPVIEIDKTAVCK